MNLIWIIFKKFVLYAVLVFISYIFIVNLTFNVEDLVDAFVKSFLIAILFTPLSLIGYFGSKISQKASYTCNININKSIDDCFKSARTILKTMNDISLIDSNLDKKIFFLQSTFSNINISLTTLNEGNTTLTITSTPKIYNNIKDYNKYIKDVQNIIMTLKLNLEPYNDTLEDLKHSISDFEIIQLFKPNLILYYRLIKLWFIISFILLISLGLYFFTINLSTNINTVIFFCVIILFIFFIFTNEIDNITKLIQCSACNNALISGKFNPINYKIPLRCPHCDKKLI